ncbi:MBL fold metallo-hydrolase [Arsenicicoccus dermatophilus]|uniref:MBL fold metallo-hydrolase n=1 Tax=Arsenicicoccus dermatophilus TaxID=1076331 RepID=UPI001F4C5E34|nr:MBL fold metallo-hydrolase [Arsenicicoccus dermatophilus]MCH8611579.1 MBL fold metallo-hydrolase [Arsenicicoccus dermatophilus]
MAGDVQVQQVITSGTFTLDGGTWDVDNNVWVLGDDDECVVLDAPHDLQPILDVVGDRTLKAILCTHAHDDHVNRAAELADATGAPILMSFHDLELWQQTYDTRQPDEDVVDGQEIEVAGVTLRALATPGHTPGGTCYHAASLGCVFSGDTLFQGGPGATGRSFSDRDTLVASIREKLFALPAETIVHTGHGADTTIGAEQESSSDW